MAKLKKDTIDENLWFSTVLDFTWHMYYTYNVYMYHRYIYMFGNFMLMKHPFYDIV